MLRQIKLRHDNQNQLKVTQWWLLTDRSVDPHRYSQYWWTSCQGNVTIWLIRLRETGNVPLLYAQLCCPCHYRSNNLTQEHSPWRDFHIMTQLHVWCELQRLCHCLRSSKIVVKRLNCVKNETAYDISECLENHHCEWFTRKKISWDKLSYHVEADLLVCDRLDHSCRHNIECRDRQRH